MSGGITIPVSLDTNQIEGDVKQIANKVTGANIANGILKGLGKATQAVKQGIDKFADMAVATAQSSDRIDKLSQKIGISAQSFQEWDYVMNLCGGSIEGMQMGMKTLRNVITEAEGGNKTYAETLNELAMASGQVIDTSKDDEDVMNQVIGALQGMSDQTLKAQLATQLFGRSATDLMPLLNATADETQAMKDEAHDLGLVLSDDAVKSGAAFNDALTKAQAAISKAGEAIISEALPSLTGLAEAFAACASGAEDGTDKLKEALTGAINNVVNIVSDKAPDILNMGVEIITTLLKGLAEALPNVAKAASDLIPTICDSLIALAPDLISAGFNVVVELAKGIVSNIPAILNAVLEIGKAMLTEILNLGTQLFEAGKNIIQGLVDGIKDKASAPINAIKDLGNGIVSGFKKVLGIHSPSKVFMSLGEYIDAGLAGGIFNSAGDVIDAAEALAEGIEGVFVYIDDMGKQVGVAMGTSIKEGTSSTVTTVETVADRIKSVMKDLNAGIIETFKSGFESMFTGFEDLGEALFNGEDAWKAFSKSGLNAIAQLLEALGALLAAKAVAAIENPAIALKLAAGSAAAYLGAGMVKGYANSFASGGIVRGSSSVGDHVPIFANAGELILNRAQQMAVAAQLSAGRGGGAVINVNFNGQVFGDQRTISEYVYEGIRAAQANGELI